MKISSKKLLILIMCISCGIITQAKGSIWVRVNAGGASVPKFKLELQTSKKVSAYKGIYYNVPGSVGLDVMIDLNKEILGTDSFKFIISSYYTTVIHPSYHSVEDHKKYSFSVLNRFSTVGLVYKLFHIRNIPISAWAEIGLLLGDIKIRGSYNFATKEEPDYQKDRFIELQERYIYPYLAWTLDYQVRERWTLGFKVIANFVPKQVIEKIPQRTLTSNRSGIDYYHFLLYVEYQLV